jgi:hypothetical protein
MILPRFARSCRDSRWRRSAATRMVSMPSASAWRWISMVGALCAIKVRISSVTVRTS